MPESDIAKLRRLDLTVLLVFIGLMRHRKGARVAAELGLTQSSISHALGRLRDAFDDPLFLRRPHGMEPTTRALELEPQIAGAVEALQAALSGPAAFDPAAAAGTLRLGALDGEAAVLVPALLARLGVEAPGLRLSVQTLGRRAALMQLEERVIDLAVGAFGDTGDRFALRWLYSDTWRLVCRPDHPILAAPITAQSLAAVRHLEVSPEGMLSGPLDKALAALGLRREVVAAVPALLPALPALAAAPLVAVLPARLAERHAADFGLVTQVLPVKLRPIRVSALRHARDARNPMHDWAIDALARIAAAALNPPA
jgi:DNA-binding transcriptional LysR family regulator